VDELALMLAQAAKFRRLAREIQDADAERALLALAVEYEQRAAAARDSAPGPADGGIAPD
jgi:hypothetical protein